VTIEVLSLSFGLFNIFCHMTRRYLLMSSREALNLRHVSGGIGGTDLLNFVK